MLPPADVADRSDALPHRHVAACFGALREHRLDRSSASRRSLPRSGGGDDHGSADCTMSKPRPAERSIRPLPPSISAACSASTSTRTSSTRRSLALRRRGRGRARRHLRDGRAHLLRRSVELLEGQPTTSPRGSRSWSERASCRIVSASTPRPTAPRRRRDLRGRQRIHNDADPEFEKIKREEFKLDHVVSSTIVA